MKFIVLVATLLLIGCAPASGTGADQFDNILSNREKCMTTESRERSKSLKQWNDLYTSIRAEKKRNKVEKHIEKVHDWRHAKHPIDTEIVTTLALILDNEVGRKKEQLRNKPGRQPAVNWLDSLRANADRMNNEVATVSALAKFEDPPCNVLRKTVVHIRQSLMFSTQLVAVDRDQISNREAVGEFELSEQESEFLESSGHALDHAVLLLDD